MRIALCISGKCDSPDAKKHVENLKKFFPFDTYTAAWDRDDRTMEVDYLFPEPEMQYNPIIDSGALDYECLTTKKWKMALNSESFQLDRYTSGMTNWTNVMKHWSKQILIHNELMRIVTDYDLIIRARFDIILSDRIEWDKFLQKSYDEECPIGFNTRHISEYAGLYHNLIHDKVNHHCNVADALLFHPRNLWDCDFVDRLHREQRLSGAEIGWYQILSEPYGNFHYNYHGGVYIEKHKADIEDIEEF